MLAFNRHSCNSNHNRIVLKEMGITKVNRHYLIDIEDIDHAFKLGIVFGRHIGKGMFADVYYAKCDSIKVALKATHKNKCSKKTFESEMTVSQILKVSLWMFFRQFIDFCFESLE